MTDYRTPITLCWHCDRPLDAATPNPDMENQGPPNVGAISLCLYCGAVAIFGEDLILRPPTEDELNQFEQDQEFVNTYLRFAWVRQYVMIHQNLLRDRKDPDR